MRIQILDLPFNPDTESPQFALVISEAAPLGLNAEAHAAFLGDFRERIGARGVFITDQPVELGPPPDWPPAKRLTSPLGMGQIHFHSGGPVYGDEGARFQGGPGVERT